MNKKIEQLNNKPKLSLHKQTIAKLSVNDMLMIEGGGTKTSGMDRACGTTSTLPTCPKDKGTK